jgi:hypothetical protein
MNQSSVLTVDGYDATLYVERGHLVVRDGFPSVRPAKRSLSAARPKLLATYRGFKDLDIIAVAP